MSVVAAAPPSPSPRASRTKGADSTATATTSNSTSSQNPLPTPASTPSHANTSHPQDAPSSSASASSGSGPKAASASGPPPLPANSGIARPAYFFPLNNNALKSQETEPEPIPDDLIVLPEDDPGAVSGIPVFKPTYEEFKDFDVYMERVAPWGMRSSIVKIIPPKEWVDAVELIDKRAMSELQIRSPIEQQMVGKNGVFVQRNVERMRNRPFSIKEWYNKCNQPDFKTPNPKEGDRTLDREKKDANWRRQQAAALKAEKAAKRAAALKRKEERDRKKAEEEGRVKVEDKSAPASPAKAAQDSSSFHTPPGQHADDDLPALETSSHTSHSDAEPLATTPAANSPDASTAPQNHDAKAPQLPPVDPFYDTADFKKDWLPEGVTQDDFTVAGCANMEKKFWKTIGMGRSSWYGADLAGSLFADPKTPWNVANLPNLLQRMKNKLPGVNTPYLYFGMWRAAFSWHVEDMDLFSINYIHFGAPKFWYAVPQADADRFESVTRSYFPNDANGCDQFMRHKSCTLSPTKLSQAGIRVNKLVQLQNEFVITFPRGYHAGFNMGFNCAESVNFALPCWLEIGKKAKTCTCVNFSVRIDVDHLLRSPTPEEEASPPPPRKRKAEEETTPAKPPRSRRRRTEPAQSVTPSETPVVTPHKDQESPVPRIPIVRLRIPKEFVTLPQEPNRPQSKVSRERPNAPCVLCPSLATDDLAPVYQPSDTIRALSMTPGVMAHVSCAIAVPEAYTEDVDMGDGQTVTYIKGLDDIDKARWKLKCASCIDQRSAKVGTKIQCTKGKCLRAYHVPCARDNPAIDYWAGDKVIDGTPTFAVELLCPTHNPSMVEMKKRKAEEELRQKVLALDQGALIKVKRNGGSHEATLLQVLQSDSKVLVQFTDGTQREMPWTAIDFQARQPQMLENEYAGPPKRSRKEQPPQASVPRVVSQPFTEAPPHVIPQTARYAPPNPAHYYPAAPMYPPATSVVMVDSKGAHMGHHVPPMAHQQVATARYHPQYGPGPGAYGPGPAFDHHARGLPPPVALSPRMGLAAPARMMAPSYAASRQPFFHPPPPQHIMRAPMGHQAPPPGPGGWHPSYPQRDHRSPAAPPPPSLPPTAPGGVGKIDLGLDRMMALMAALPPMTVPAVHLAGTNGKGSVSALMESCFRAAGFRTARYNSPHLIEARDAIRIDGVPPSREQYSHALAQIERVSEERGLKATMFEIATAAFFFIANTAQPPVDVMIVECGMGGLRDATNVMPENIILASGLTSVGLDHTDRLGNTIEEIAREKASIVVPGAVLVTSPHLNPEALTSAHRVTDEKGAHLVQAQPTTVMAPSSTVSLAPFREPAPLQVRTPLAGTKAKYLDTHLTLGGSHQLDNLSLALTLLDVMRHDKRALSIQPKLTALTEAHLQAGIASARWEGRCSWLTFRDGDTTIPLLADGAHNADSAATLQSYIDTLGLPSRPRTFILSLSANPAKTPESVLAPLLRPGDRVGLVDFTTPVEGMPWIRPADRAAVRSAAEALVGGRGEVRDLPGAGPRAVAEALKWAVSDWKTHGPGLVVVCGSLYLVADAYRLITA